MKMRQKRRRPISKRKEWKKNRIRNIFSILPRSAFSCWMSLVRQYIGALWIRGTYRHSLPIVKIIAHLYCCTERKRKYVFFNRKMATNLTSRGLRRNPNVINCSRPVLIVYCMHSWASASRPMPPASAFRHPIFQYGTGAFRYWTESSYSGTGLFSTSTFLSIPVPEWSDAGQSGIPALIKTYTLHVHTAAWKEYHGRLVTKKKAKTSGALSLQYMYWPGLI